jgi:peptide/nickel transport system permease protein
MNKSVLYIIRRFFFYCLAGFMAVTLNFIIPRLMPGDPASIMFAQFKGKLKPEALDALKETFGFAEGPIILQYFDYLKHLLNGDFGISISYFPQPVTEVISSGLYWTLFLAGTSLVISFVLGSLIGVYLAWYRDQKLDSILLPSLSFLGAFPYFFIAMLFLYYFGFILGWFPLRHAFGESVTAGFNLEFIFSVITHSILPAFTLIFVTLGGWVLSMRNNMIATLGSEYINYAKAVGYNRKILMFKFAARNALLPSVTSFGMALGFILSGALLTEIIFSYPGQGYLLLQAVRSQDFPLLQGIFLTITFSVLLSNWIVDIVLMLLDPRVRR